MKKKNRIKKSIVFHPHQKSIYKPEKQKKGEKTDASVAEFSKARNFNLVN